MALARLRRDNGILICDNIVDFSGFGWKTTKPILRTITGVTVPQQIAVEELYFSLTLEFASDDPVNSLARYDILHNDHSNDRFFRYFHIDSEEYRCQVYTISDPARQDFNTEDVIRIEIMCKVEGFRRG